MEKSLKRVRFWSLNFRTMSALSYFILKISRKEKIYEEVALIHIGHCYNLNNTVNSASAADVENGD